MAEKRKINGLTNDSVAQALADRDYWTEWGHPLGLDLRGFNGRATASFHDRETGIIIYTEGQLAFLTRLRNESLANGSKRVE